MHFVVDGYTCATDAKSQATGASRAWNTHPPHSRDRHNEGTIRYNPLPDTIVHNHVNIDTLEYYLRGHPDPHLVQYVLTGLRIGFDLGFNGSLAPIRRNNNKSARDNRAKVTQAIFKEVSRGHTAGPFPHPPFPINHISPLGAAPKMMDHADWHWT